MNDRKAIGWLMGQLPGLEERGVLSPSACSALRDHYGVTESSSGTRNLTLTICSVLGGLLVGAGIILLIAHNWEMLGRGARTILSFAPLVAAATISGWALRYRSGSRAWCEGACGFHVAAIGASISLVSQTYKISGSLDDFLLVWSLLSLPLLYLFRSSVAGLLYLAGITAWGVVCIPRNSWWSWVLIVAVVPFFLGLRRDRSSRDSSGMSLGLVLSTGIALGNQILHVPGNWMVPFSGFFTTLYFADYLWFRDAAGKGSSSFRLLGVSGVALLSILLTFQNMMGHWDHLVVEISLLQGLLLNYGPLVTALILLILCIRGRKDANWVVAGLPVVALLATSIWKEKHRMGNDEPVFALLTNGYAALLALVTILRGLRHGSLKTLNEGLLLASVLIVCRFFSDNLGFVARGVAFILIGIAFLFSNWLLVRKRRTSKP